MQFEMEPKKSFSLSTEKMKSIRHWLGYWWISWFGILGGFFVVGVSEYTHESPAARHFSLILMIVIGLFWIVFFVADAKAGEKADGEGRSELLVDLLTLMGTFLAAFTLLGIGFFVFVAPRVP